MKYHNRKTVVNGQTFDSKKEANRYSELLLLERAGQFMTCGHRLNMCLFRLSGVKRPGRSLNVNAHIRLISSIQRAGRLS